VGECSGYAKGCGNHCSFGEYLGRKKLIRQFGD
jgi:hypothetical protein